MIVIGRRTSKREVLPAPSMEPVIASRLHPSIKQVRLSDESQELIRVALTKLNLSARSYDRILKVSRMVADRPSSDEITSEHVSEAIQYRIFDRTLWVYRTMIP